MAGGYRWDWDNDITLGFLAAMDYDDNWLTTVQQRTDYIVSGDELLPENDYTYDTTLRRPSH